MHLADQEESFVLFEGVTFPFSEERSWRRLWWVLFLAFVPVLDFVVFRGWRLAIVRRMLRGEDSFLPSIGGFPRYCLNGVVLWGMTAFYALPGVVLLLVFGGTFVTLALDVGWWLVQKFLLWRDVSPFWSLIGQGFTQMLVGASPAALYVIVIGPAYRAGMLRYASGQGIMSFLNIPKNVMMVLRDPAGFYGAWAIDKIFGTVWLTVGLAAGSVVASAVAATALLLPLAPLFGMLVIGMSLTVYYWTTAYVYGDLGRTIDILDRTKLSAGGTLLGGAAPNMLPATPPDGGELIAADTPTRQFCASCGSPARPGIRFCAQCGNAQA